MPPHFFGCATHADQLIRVGLTGVSAFTDSGAWRGEYCCCLPVPDKFSSKGKEGISNDRNSTHRLGSGASQKQEFWPHPGDLTCKPAKVGCNYAALPPVDSPQSLATNIMEHHSPIHLMTFSEQGLSLHSFPTSGPL